MSNDTFRARLLAGEFLAGTFVKTPAHEVVEVLARSGLDFICLDAEHGPWDRRALDVCLAVARGLDFPVLVRVPAGNPELMLGVLDSGAVGCVVPHVDSVAKAEAVAKAGRFGHGGRGYAGATRWANYGAYGMAGTLQRSREETVIIAQIEEPEGVADAEGIAGTEGIDGLFIGPADLSVAFGKTVIGGPELETALAAVGQAAAHHGKAYMTFVPNAEAAQVWVKHGLTTFFIGSELVWMGQVATAQAAGIHGLEKE
ncbi:MAG: HpcH/HpaI aldolase family protein [Shimia sp.]